MILPANPVRYERDMLPLLFPHLSRLLESNRRPLTILSAPAIGAVIPDLLVGAWSEPPETLPSGKPTIVESSVLALLQREGSLSLRQIRGRLYLRQPVAERAVGALERLGMVHRESDARFRASSTTAGQSVEITAIEAKMRRWTDAVGQAEAYLEFANRAIVVLDGNQVGGLTSRIENACATRGIGLWLLYQRAIRTPVSSEPHDPEPSPMRTEAGAKLLLSYRSE